MKHFPTGRARSHRVLVFWKPAFMAYLFRTFIYHPFSIKDAEECLKYKMSPNAIRLRIRRLHKTGWLKRNLDGKSDIRPGRKIYLYEFTEGSRKYRAYHGYFNYEKGPLMKHILCNARR